MIALHTLHTTDRKPRVTHSCTIIMLIGAAWLEGKKGSFGWFRANYYVRQLSCEVRRVWVDGTAPALLCTAKILVFDCRSCAIRRYYAALHQVVKGYLYCKVVMSDPRCFFFVRARTGKNSWKNHEESEHCSIIIETQLRHFIFTNRLKYFIFFGLVLWCYDIRYACVYRKHARVLRVLARTYVPYKHT